MAKKENFNSLMSLADNLTYYSIKDDISGQPAEKFMEEIEGLVTDYFGQKDSLEITQYQQHIAERFKLLYSSLIFLPHDLLWQRKDFLMKYYPNFVQNCHIINYQNIEDEVKKEGLSRNIIIKRNEELKRILFGWGFNALAVYSKPYLYDIAIACLTKDHDQEEDFVLGGYINEIDCLLNDYFINRDESLKERYIASLAEILDKLEEYIREKHPEVLEEYGIIR